IRFRVNKPLDLMVVPNKQAGIFKASQSSVKSSNDVAAKKKSSQDKVRKQFLSQFNVTTVLKHFNKIINAESTLPLKKSCCTTLNQLIIHLLDKYCSVIAQMHIANGKNPSKVSTSVKTVCAATRVLFTGELMNHAMTEGCKCVTKLNASKSMKL
ncbi:MAG: hypothetical protein MHPSP_002240, partial [Paramarteilia canceri]